MSRCSARGDARGPGRPSGTALAKLAAALSRLLLALAGALGAAQRGARGCLGGQRLAGGRRPVAGRAGRGAAAAEVLAVLWLMARGSACMHAGVASTRVVQARAAGGGAGTHGAAHAPGSWPARHAGRQVVVQGQAAWRRHELGVGGRARARAV